MTKNGLFKKLILIELTDDGPKGYILEGKFEYSKELQDLRNDYPLAHDKIEII